MKTSNKLLITLAVLILLIPLSAMIYDSKNYVDKKGWKPAKTKRFDEKLKGYHSIPFNDVPFNSIKILNGNGYEFHFTFIEDKQSGIKMADKEYGMAEMRLTSESNGELSIIMADIPKRNRKYISFLVYAPDFGKLSITNAESLWLEGTAAQLEVHAKNVGQMSFNETSLFNKLLITSENVESVSVSRVTTEELTAHITEGKFITYYTKFKTLDLTASGKAELTLGPPPGGSRKQDSIENLSIHTLGAVTINIENVFAKNVSGSLSDSTQVTMPVLYLKQLIKQ